MRVAVRLQECGYQYELIEGFIGGWHSPPPEQVHQH
jgi:hypothetical protein